jgi:hypothetical protein
MVPDGVAANARTVLVPLTAQAGISCQATKTFVERSPVCGPLSLGVKLNVS